MVWTSKRKAFSVLLRYCSVKYWNNVGGRVRTWYYKSTSIYSRKHIFISLRCIIIETQKWINRIGYCRGSIAFEQKFRSVGPAIVRIAHRLGQEDWIFNGGLIWEAKMTESIVQHMLKALGVIDYILVEHWSLLYLPWVKFVELISYQVHRIHCFVHYGLWFCYKIAES